MEKEQKKSKTNKYILLNPEYSNRYSKLFSEETIDKLSEESIIALDEGDFDTFGFFLHRELSEDASYLFDLFSISEEQLDEKIHPMTYTQRLKRAQIMRKYKSKLKFARDRARNKRATPEKIKSRARKKAIELLRKRFLKNRNYIDLSVSEKNALDLRMARLPNTLIDRIAVKQIVTLRKLEAERLASIANHPVNERFHNMFNKDDTVKHDKRFKIYRETKKLIEDTEEFIEASAVDLAKERIKSEKMQDDVKHKRMIDQAKDQDKRTRQIRHEEKDPFGRLEGTKKLSDLFKKETPGQ